MGLTLLEAPPSTISDGQLPRLSVVEKGGDAFVAQTLTPIPQGTFEDAWNALERTSRRDDLVGYVLPLKYALAGTQNLMRISEYLRQLPAGEPEIEVVKRQQSFAMKSLQENLSSAGLQIEAAPTLTPQKVPMQESLHALTQVKDLIAENNTVAARAVFSKALLQISTEFGSNC